MNDSSLLVLVLGLALQMLQQWRGFKAVERKVENNYVPVPLYRDKIAELHGKINALEVKVAVLEERHK